MKEYLTIQLKKFNGNISKTANFVGTERSALHRKLKGLGIKELINEYNHLVLAGWVSLSKQLSEQGHSITVIDPSSEDIQK